MEHRRRTDEGAVTAEAAVVIPSLVLVALLGVGLVIAVGTELKCVDAAREAARLAARGETDTVVQRAVHAVAPADAHLTVHRSDGWVQVRVTAELKPWGLMPGVPLGASAKAEEEQP